MRYYILLVLSVLSFSVAAQFPNPSFEQNTSMPQLLGEWNKATAWTNAGSDLAAPDYFKVGASAACDLPETPFGVLSPNNGSAMMGLLCAEEISQTKEPIFSANFNPL